MDFLYVDRAVVITCPEITDSDEGKGEEHGFTWFEKTKTKAFKIELQKGWNALHWHVTGIYRETESSYAYDTTKTLHAGNPSRLRWTIFEWGG